MAYRLQYSGASVLYLPDAALRLEPGQTITVPAITPQMGQVASRGVLAITDLTPPSAPRAMVAPAAVPTPVPLAAPVQSASTRPRHRNAAAVLPPRLLARVQQVVTGYYISSFRRVSPPQRRGGSRWGRSSNTVPPRRRWPRRWGSVVGRSIASSATWRWPIHRRRRLRPYRPPSWPRCNGMSQAGSMYRRSPPLCADTSHAWPCGMR